MGSQGGHENTRTCPAECEQLRCVELKQPSQLRFGESALYFATPCATRRLRHLTSMILRIQAFAQGGALEPDGSRVRAFSDLLRFLHTCAQSSLSRIAVEN